MQEETNEIPKQPNKVPPVEYNESQPSDDDDFPDEQEIFQANGLLKLQKTLSGPVSSLSYISSDSFFSLETNGFSSTIYGSNTFISTCNR
jgi:hypothetical protein